MFKRILGTLALGFLPIYAACEDLKPGFVLLPEAGRDIAASTGGGFTFGTSGGVFEYSIFTPLRKPSDGALLLDFAIQATTDDRLALQSAGAMAGLVWRHRASENSIVGLNAYLEALRPNSQDQTFGLMSLGAEYDYRSPDQRGFMQLGANAYLPFDDYTDVDKYGTLGAAPRQGLDAYASLGRGYDGYTLRGTVSGFSYAETDTARALSGYRVDGEIEWTRGLPENMTITGSVGLRDDSRLNSDLSVVAGLEASWEFGGLGTAGDVARDCALLREGEGRPRVDCAERVLPGGGGGKLGKVAPVAVAAAPPAAAQAVSRPRRHLGFGSAMTPIEYKDASLQLVKQARGGNGSFGFTSSVVALNTILHTINGRAATDPVRVNAGRYTITEGPLPEGWSLVGARCSGAIGSGVDLASRALWVEIVPGAAVSCTFENSYTPQAPAPTPAPAPAEIGSGTIQITKATVGTIEAPVSFSFTGSDTALTQSLSVPAGTNGAATGAVVTLGAGQYTITEDTLPPNWSLTGLSCSDGSAVDLTTRTATVDLAANEAVVCTYTNTYSEPQPGSLAGRLYVLEGTNQIPLAGETVILSAPDGSEIARTQTDANGAYRFDNVPPDTGYRVTMPFSARSGHQILREDVTNSTASNSDAPVNGRFTGVDVGDGENVVNVDGIYNDPGTSCIRGRLFSDLNRSNRDENEPWLWGAVLVQLISDDGRVLSQSTVNPADGRYEFCGLNRGTFFVQFPTGVPGTTGFSLPNQGDDINDSDANQINGRSEFISLRISEIRDNVDAGYYPAELN